MKGVIFSCVALVCIFAGAQVTAEFCNTLSTARIIGKLCFLGDNKSNETLVNGFFGCYDKADGKDEFVKCQTDAFGGPMNSVPAVTSTCGKLDKVKTYVDCLNTEFAKANLTMDPIVKQINDCQSEVMNIKPFSLICRD